MALPLQLSFVTSAPTVELLPPTRREVAFVGRSNVGKSSLLNALAGEKGLAKVSSNPGRTQLLNCFRTPSGSTVVDLPGYGYTSTGSVHVRHAWQERMEHYLLQREGLRLTMVLIDGEVGPTKLDREFLSYLREHRVSFRIVATKHDKVKSSARVRRRRDLATGVALDDKDVLWVSAEKNVGLDKVRDVVREALGG